jgi:2-phospho-L-lactate transferase/gluconeogenesis factor (CofD/UPF0052 family)
MRGCCGSVLMIGRQWQTQEQRSFISKSFENISGNCLACTSTSTGTNGDHFPYIPNQVYLDTVGLTSTRIGASAGRSLCGEPFSIMISSATVPFTGAASRVERTLKIVIFSGGRGSSVLSKELLRDPRIELTLAINGYDDGLSTGEVRRFLGESLGPSDYRKNANRLAAELNTCPKTLIELLELRIPKNSSYLQGRTILKILQRKAVHDRTDFPRRLHELVSELEEKAAADLWSRIVSFDWGLDQTARQFDFSDCSIGNIVFAGCYLAEGRDFNLALASYCSLVGLPKGMIENVTDGANAFLVAIDNHGQILGNEADIVDTKRRNRIDELFLLREPLTEGEIHRLNASGPNAIRTEFARRSVPISPNPSVLDKLGAADIIVYAPGTQHSSLFPSYLTPGIGRMIAQNLRAFKILITNLQEDADLAESSAVEIIERAVYYLREKGRLTAPAPCLITHYLINDPQHAEESDPYLPLGLVDTLEDPRLVRIGNYEDGITGRHDASRLLQPFIGLLDHRKIRLAILLLESNSINKLSQTLIEMVRGEFGTLDVEATVFYESADSLQPEFADCLPFEVSNLWGRNISSEEFWDIIIDPKAFDYVVLFESSGMYKGEDIVPLVSHLTSGQLDAVWGSRRLSLTDIHYAYRLLHRTTPIRGAISYIGSHMLSLAYLFLYGHYVNDALSGVRAVRTSILREHALHPKQPGVNHRILSALLRRCAQMIETPVRYFPISPHKVRRTTIGEGLQALWTIICYRFTHRGPSVLRTDARHLLAGLSPIQNRARRISAGR